MSPQETNVAAVWDDLLVWLSRSWDVTNVDEESTDLRWRASDHVQTLQFGPAAWYQFVTDGGSYEAQETPGWALDELWEMLGSKTILFIDKGRIRGQRSSPGPLSGRWSVVDKDGQRHYWDESSKDPRNATADD